MRQIKFRSFVKECNPSKEAATMVYSDRVGGVSVLFRDFEDDPIMQFTGLKDKNGVEIYEGDIVKMFYQDWLDKTEVIKFKDGTFGYGGEFHFSPFHCLAQDMRDARYHFSHAFEVIGNIYQNPEMLK